MVEEGVFPLERLLAADEVFTSSSVREVMPVVAVDGRRSRAGRRRPRSRQALRATRHALTATASAAQRGVPVLAPAVDDEVRAADGIVALDVAVLGRHPDVDPGAPRLLAVARDAPREPHVVRRLDPDPHRVGVAERAVERADALDDHDAGGLDRP